MAQESTLYIDPNITTEAKKLVENTAASAGLIIAIAKATQAVKEAVKKRINQRVYPAH